MNEVNAIAIARGDMEQLAETLDQAAGPHEVLDIALDLLAVRTHAIHPDDKTIDAILEKVRANPAPTLSRTLCEASLKLVVHVGRKSQPEDIRALLLWMVGNTSVGPGLMGMLIARVADQDTASAIERLTEQAQRLHQAINRRDHTDFTVVTGRLTGPQQKVIAGMKLAARWCAIEGDGETAREKLVTARRIANVLDQRNQRVQRLFYGRVAQGES